MIFYTKRKNVIKMQVSVRFRYQSQGKYHESLDILIN